MLITQYAPLHVQQNHFGPDSPVGTASVLGAQHDMSAIGDRNALFNKFKRDAAEGRRLNAVVKERQQQLKDLKQSIKVG